MINICYSLLTMKYFYSFSSILNCFANLAKFPMHVYIDVASVRRGKHQIYCFKFHNLKKNKNWSNFSRPTSVLLGVQMTKIMAKSMSSGSG